MIYLFQDVMQSLNTNLMVFILKIIDPNLELQSFLKMSTISSQSILQQSKLVEQQYLSQSEILVWKSKLIMKKVELLVYPQCLSQKESLNSIVITITQVQTSFMCKNKITVVPHNLRSSQVVMKIWKLMKTEVSFETLKKNHLLFLELCFKNGMRRSSKGKVYINVHI